MKRYPNQCLLLIGLLAFLTMLGTARSTEAGNIEDPRAQKIALVIGYTMSHQQDRIAAITGVAKTEALLSPGETLADPDFYLAGAYVRSFSLAKSKGRLAGLVYHRDALSRMIMTRFHATFREGAKLAITKVDLTPTYAPTPRTSLYFVPANKVAAAKFNGLPFKDALLKANRYAIPAEGQKGDARPRAYTVVAFMMDRQAPDVQMEVVQSPISGSASGDHRQRGQNQEGWCYTVLPAKFAYNKGQENFFNVFLHVDQHTWPANTYATHSLLKRTQRALAQRGYDPGPADGLMGKKTRQAIQRFQKRQGIPADGKPSLALLSILRATERPPGVQFTQTALKQLGYDPGPADGQMGRKTSAAIRAYQSDCGLVADGALSAGLLCHLATTAGPMPIGAGTSPAASGTNVNRFESRQWPNQLATP